MTDQELTVLHIWVKPVGIWDLGPVNFMGYRGVVT